MSHTLVATQPEYLNREMRYPAPVACVSCDTSTMSQQRLRHSWSIARHRCDTPRLSQTHTAIHLLCR